MTDDIVVDGEKSSSDESHDGQTDGKVDALAEAKAEIEKLARNLEQSRKEEKFSKGEYKKLKEQLDAMSNNPELTELKTKFEEAVAAKAALEAKIKNSQVDSALIDALKTANVKSVTTVMKLVNRDEIGFDGEKVDAETINKIITKLKQEDPVLFNDATPPVRRGVEGTVTGGYEAEIKAAKTHKEIEAVMRRYGKM